MFLLVVVTVKFAINPHLPNAVSFAHLNLTLVHWSASGGPRFSFAHGPLVLLVDQFLLFRFGRVRVSEENCSTNELFIVIIDFAVVMFGPGHTHRFDEPLLQMVDEPGQGRTMQAINACRMHSWARTRRSRSIRLTKRS
jgi:hypothetical protein